MDYFDEQLEDVLAAHYAADGLHVFVTGAGGAIVQVMSGALSDIRQAVADSREGWVSWNLAFRHAGKVSLLDGSTGELNRVDLTDAQVEHVYNKLVTLA